MLTFEEKKKIIEEFPELEEQKVSMNRLNYHFNESAVAKTIVVKYLHPKSHNAFVYAGYLPSSETKDGYISVINASEEELRERIRLGIEELKKTEDGFPDGYEEVWEDDRADILRLRYIAPVWGIVMQTEGIEAIFKTKEAGEAYLEEEGFFLKETQA
ncbi:hypothetical protein ACWN8V_12645 [Vagococcus elongatus]|uniref:Uncharacterized protein n=1 Tax=Vagococcus elongatus TaxID=180344 RepID=A0A430AM79_9ENTE|nr:hypothetical protein [Vagococcus elongatus]RSU09007.1 hypothetical protein CBF29_12405 [Vagococcus elongatus]